MIRVEATENEYLLYIPASQRERAKRIRPREWDWRRVCWVYPQTKEIYSALQAEFGNDPSATFAIAHLEPDGGREKEQNQAHESSALKRSLSQLRKENKELKESVKRLSAEKDRIAASLEEDLRVSKLQLTGLNTQLQRAAEYAERLSSEGIQNTGELTARIEEKESEIGELHKLYEKLREENAALSGKVDQNAIVREGLENEMAAAERKNGRDIASLKSANSRLESENRELLIRIESLECICQRQELLQENGGGTDPDSRPNKKVLSEAIDIYRDAMRPFIIRNLKQVPGGTLEETIKRSLHGRQKDEFCRNLERHQDVESAIDVGLFPFLLRRNWEGAFAFRFKGEKMIENEMWMIREARNEVSHPPADDIEADFTGVNLYLIVKVLGRINATEQQNAVIDIKAEWEKTLRLIH